MDIRSGNQQGIGAADVSATVRVPAEAVCREVKQPSYQEMPFRGVKQPSCRALPFREVGEAVVEDSVCQRVSDANVREYAFGSPQQEVACVPEEVRAQLAESAPLSEREGKVSPRLLSGMKSGMTLKELFGL